VEVGALHGFDTAEPYFDRLSQQVGRLLGSIDAAANGLGMMLDLQLNQRAYLLSIVATIFVPLTFVTGFYGMNFKWMTDHIESAIAFWGLAIVVPATVGLVAWHRWVRPWLVGDQS
jgi:Mg2+ and Co2+ transporter CorA